MTDDIHSGPFRPRLGFPKGSLLIEVEPGEVNLQMAYPRVFSTATVTNNETGQQTKLRTKLGSETAAESDYYIVSISPEDESGWLEFSVQKQASGEFIAHDMHKTGVDSEWASVDAVTAIAEALWRDIEGFNSTL